MRENDHLDPQAAQGVWGNVRELMPEPVTYEDLVGAAQGDRNARLRLAETQVGLVAGLKGWKDARLNYLKARPEIPELLNSWLHGADKVVGEEGKVLSATARAANVRTARALLANEELPPEVRNEMLRRLTAETKVRQNPETGEHEFLLHRMDAANAPPISDMPSSSWSANNNVNTGANAGWARGTSAWIPKDRIGMYIPPLGSTEALKAEMAGRSRKFVGAPTHYREESEVLVKRLSPQLEVEPYPTLPDAKSVHELINSRAKGYRLKEQYRKPPLPFAWKGVRKLPNSPE